MRKGGSGFQIGAALGFVYLSWGSTYLVMRWAIASLSPWMLATVRAAFVCLILVGVASLLGQAWPRTRRSWAVLIFSGLLMLVVASGTVVWGQQWVPSGETALVMSASAFLTPWWAALGASGDRFPRPIAAALLVGVIGLGLVMGVGGYRPGTPASSYGAMLVGAAAWSAGTVLLRRYPVDCGMLMLIGLQSGIAAVCFSLLAFVVDPRESTWTATSVSSMAYLIVCGSVLGYGAYYWLVPRVEPALLGTISVVNPVVAVLLGALLASERLSVAQGVGALLILGSLVTVTLSLRHYRRLELASAANPPRSLGPA